MTQSIFQSIGDLSFPIAGVTDSLAVLETARAKIVGLFTAAINAEWSAAWNAVVGTLPTGHPFTSTVPVQDTLELEPTPQVMQQRKAAFPLLCVYTVGEATYDQITLQEERLTQEWGVDYILGPLDIGDIRKFGDICRGIGKLLRVVCRLRAHPAYESGALQFYEGSGNLATIELTSQQGPGQASFAGDEGGTLYYAISFKLRTTETTADNVDGFGNFDAADLSVGVGNATEIVPDLIQADTSIPLQRG